MKLRAENRLGELLRGKREATDYARMSIDQSSSVLCKLGEPDNRFEKILVDRRIIELPSEMEASEQNIIKLSFFGPELDIILSP